MRPADSAVFITTSQGALIRWVGVGQCVGVNALVPAYATAVLASNDFTFVGAIDATSGNIGNVVLTRLNPDGGSPSSQTVGFGQVWEFSRPTLGPVLAAGWEHSTQRRNRVWAYDLGSAAWSDSWATSNSSTDLYAVDTASASLGFAAGKAFVQWSGGSNWTYRPTPPIEVYGLKVFSATEVYAVGNDTVRGRGAFAVWDGNTWSIAGSSVGPAGYLNRVRGSSRCGLLGVGSGGNAVTTFP